MAVTAQVRAELLHACQSFCRGGEGRGGERGEGGQSRWGDTTTGREGREMWRGRCERDVEGRWKRRREVWSRGRSNTVSRHTITDKDREGGREEVEER